MLPPQYGMVSKEENSEVIEDLQLTAQLGLHEIHAVLLLSTLHRRRP